MNAWGQTPGWLRWTQHEVTLLVLFFLLVGELIFVGGPLLLGATRCRCRHGHQAYVYQTPHGLEIHDEMSCDDCLGLRHPFGDPVAIIYGFSIDQTSGLGFDTIRTRGLRFDTISWGANPIPESMTLDAHLAATNDPELYWLETFQPGGSLRRTVHWSGVLWNLTTLLVMICFAYGFITRRQRAIRLERLRRGRCPVCKYSIAGLPTNRCPECGSLLRAPGRASLE